MTDKKANTKGMLMLIMGLAIMGAAVILFGTGAVTTKPLRILISVIGIGGAAAFVVGFVRSPLNH